MDGAFPRFLGAVGALQLVTTGKSAVCSFNLNNETGQPAYLQFFDAASIADVTLGTTTPVKSIPVRGNSTGVEAYDSNPLLFLNGIVIAVTTTASGAILSSMTVNVSIRKPF